MASCRGGALDAHSSSARVTASRFRGGLRPHPRAQLFRGSAGFLAREELLDGNLIKVAIGSDVLIDSLDEEFLQVGRAGRDVRVLVRGAEPSLLAHRGVV